MKMPDINRSDNNNSGFTLIEMMVVMIIIGILAALVAPRLMNRADQAKVTEAEITDKEPRDRPQDVQDGQHLLSLYRAGA